MSLPYAAVTAFCLTVTVFVLVFITVKIFTGTNLIKQPFKLKSKKINWPRLTCNSNQFENLVRLSGYYGYLPDKKIIFSLSIFLTLFLCLGWGYKGILIVPSILMLGFTIIKNRAVKNQQKLEAQLPDALYNLADTYKAGFTFYQAVDFLAAELPAPIREIFLALQRGLKLNLPLPVLLEAVSNQLKMPVWDNVAEILKLGLNDGGNLIPLLQTEAKTILNDLKSEQDIKTMTAGGRSSGLIVALLVPAAVVFFWFTSPDYIYTLFSATPGRFLVAVSAGLELVGYLWIKQIIKVV